VKWATEIEIKHASPSVTPQEGIIGITGYKLIFTETMNNSLSSPASIDYYWTFHIDKWNGTQWVATAINVSAGSVLGYSVAALTTVNLPYYVDLLNSSGLNAVAWGDWLRVSFTFQWALNGTSYSANYMAKLNVHPADIADATVAFPYLGADGSCGADDFHVLATYWLNKVPSGTDPTSDLARADIGGYGSVGPKDFHMMAEDWLLSWTNTPPS
jgi:hypothetical protein